MTEPDSTTLRRIEADATTSPPDKVEATSLRRVDVDEAEARSWLHANGFTDGLPVAIPEVDVVAEAVAHSGRAANEVLGQMPPQFAAVTIEKVAVCAVMAGCPPDALPAVVAATEAVLAAPFRVASVQATTSPATPFFVFSGPATDKFGLVSGTGSLGPAAGTNFAIGRAIRLLMLTVGGGVVGNGDPASLGMPAKLAAVCAERVEGSPWPSLAERRGFRVDQTAAVAFPITGMWQISEPTTVPSDVAHQLLHGMISAGQCSQPRLPQSGEQLLVVTPPIAQLLAHSFPAVADLQHALFDTVRIPMAWIPPYKHAATRDRLDELGIAVHGDLIPITESPDAFEVIVTGGDAGVQSMGMSTLTLSRSSAAAIRPA